MIPELSDRGREISKLPDVEARSWLVRLRAWVLVKLAGDSLVVINCNIIGGIRNFGSPHTPVVVNCFFEEGDPEYWIELDPKYDRRVF